MPIQKTVVVPGYEDLTEIVPRVELEDGATAKSPGWAIFSISSMVQDTEQWTEHCSGPAKVEVITFEQILPIELEMQKPGLKKSEDESLFKAEFESSVEIMTSENKCTLTIPTLSSA